MLLGPIFLKFVLAILFVCVPITAVSRPCAKSNMLLIYYLFHHKFGEKLPAWKSLKMDTSGSLLYFCFWSAAITFSWIPPPPYLKKMYPDLLINLFCQQSFLRLTKYDLRAINFEISSASFCIGSFTVNTKVYLMYTHNILFWGGSYMKNCIWYFWHIS